VKVPKGWSIQRLEEVAEIQTGIAKGVHVAAEMVSLPYLRVANVQDGHVDLTEMKEIEVPKDKINRFLLRRGDLLMTEGGDFNKLGRGCLWQGQIDPCLHQNHVFAVRVTSPILHNQFLAILAASSYGRRYFTGCSKQSTNLASINTSQIRAFPVLMPPLAEQRRITEILGAWNRAIEMQQKLLAAKTTRLGSFRHQLLTGNKRFPEFRGVWPRIRLEKVSEEMNVRNQGNVPDDRLFAVTKADGLVPMKDRVKGISTQRCMVVETDWYAYNPMRLNIGSIARLYSPQPVMVSPDYVVFRTKSDKLLPDYLDHLRRSQLWTDFVSKAGSGSVRVRIYFDALGLLSFRLPPLPEQRRIAAVLNACQREIDLLATQLEALKQQKRGIMQKLLMGEVRVPVSKRTGSQKH
jgi:type I restriction enzyme S subunit